MLRKISLLINRWSLAQRFMLAGLVFLVVGAIVIGSWVAAKIRLNMINEAAAATALYMDSFISPNIQELGGGGSLTPGHFENLNTLLETTDLGRQIVTIKIWGMDNSIIFSNTASLVGRTFPAAEDMEEARNGKIVASITDLQDDENVEERKLYSRLLEIYIPIRLNGTHEVIAVAEFYRGIENLEAQIQAAQRESWLVVSAIMTAIYLVLIGFVQSINQTIARQETGLRNQVWRLTELLTQNEELDKKMRRAAVNTTALNERFLRRTSAELHDGPVQQVSLALLRLDRVNAQNETCRVVNEDFECNDHLPTVQTSLQTALQEMRSIASNLGLPSLEKPSLDEVIHRVARSHERQTRTKVTVNTRNLPADAALPVKITVYRLLQEALSNAYIHGGGMDQWVRAACENELLQIEISDKGPGFDVSLISEDEHLGLAGMRERVESLGGIFEIQSVPGEGTIVNANIFLGREEVRAHE